jgi:HK97 family phage portal protein
MSFEDKILSLFGYRRFMPSGVDFMSFDGNKDTEPFYISFDKLPGVRKAYCKCSPVSTMINRLASSMANGQWWLTDKDNNDVRNVHTELGLLLKRPNPLQIRTEFIKQVDIYRSLYGITYIWAVIPEGFASPEDAVALWPLNPERITPVYKENTRFYYNRNIEDIIEKYVITVGNETINVNPKEILCIKDNSLDMLSENEACTTKLKGLEYEVRNIMQAQEAIYSLNKDRGAMGIITNKSKDASGNIPLIPEEKEELHTEIKKNYGLSHKQAKVIITNADLGWTPMSFNVRDLMLFEGIKQNIESIADAFNYPFELLANQKGTTYANRNEAIKYLYQDNVIPNANIYAEKFTNFFNLENAKIEIDFSNVEYLKEAQKEKAEALLKMNNALKIAYELNVITREEYREALDLDEKPKGETYYDENTNETTGEA